MVTEKRKFEKPKNSLQNIQ